MYVHFTWFKFYEVGLSYFWLTLVDHELVENTPNAARIGYELTEIREDSWWFARFSLTSHDSYKKKPIHAWVGGGRGISSKMNVPRLSAVELILQLECLKQLLILLEENNYVNVERPWPWLFDLEKYGSSPSGKPPARSYWLILIVLLNLPNLFQLPGLARMYARDGVVTLRESPSTISSLVSLLVLISRLPMNELRVATNA